jgi:hypothetical protein
MRAQRAVYRALRRNRSNAVADAVKVDAQITV